MKRSLGILSVAVVSTLALTGCPSGGGSSNNTQVGVGQLNAGSCTIQPSSYTCSQTLNGIVYTTPSVSYVSQQDLCAKINDNYSYTNKDVRGQVVATEWRQNYFNTSCQNVVQPTQPITGLKTFTCNLQVRKGDAVFVGEPQQFYLPATGGKTNLFANSLKSKTTGRFFRVTRAYMIELANVVVEYKAAFAGNPASMDQIKMSVAGIDDDISASVTGFAGAENTLTITPRDSFSDQTELMATCTSSDALQRPVISAPMGTYKCEGTELADGRATPPINYVNQISDVVTSGISITNSVFVQGDQASGVRFTQSMNRLDDSVVSVKSSLSAPISVKIGKLSYSLDVNCQPK